MLDTYFLLRLLHPSGLLYFGAPNTGRHHIACSLRQGDGFPGGLTLALEGRHCRPQCVSVAETWQRLPRCLPGVSAAGEARC